MDSKNLKAHSMKIEEFLRAIGAKKRGDYFILDEWDYDIYLYFDVTDNPERPDTWGTCNVFLEHTGNYADRHQFPLKDDCTVEEVANLILALGLERFSQKTQDVIVQFKMSNPKMGNLS